MIRECSTCGAQIRLVRAATGNYIPVDAQPSEDRGNIYTVRGVARVLGPEDAARAREEGYDLYLSHFATCPDAIAHRRRSHLHVVDDRPPAQLQLL